MRVALEVAEHESKRIQRLKNKEDIVAEAAIFSDNGKIEEKYT